MVKNIESIIKEYKLSQMDVIKINKMMHKSSGYLKFPNGENWDKWYAKSFKRNTILYLNSKDYKNFNKE